jgi:2-hydroxychromene-2-carboxylate isomerase
MLVVWFDYASLSSAVAVLRVHALARDAHAVAFGGVDPLGVDVTLPATLDQLADFDRARDAAHAVGLAAARPRIRPSTMRAHLVGEVAEEVGRGIPWREIALRAMWEAGADLADPGVLRSLGRAAGVDPAALDAALGDPGRLRAVRQRMLRARQRGIGDVPVLDLDGAIVSAELSDGDLRTLLAL